MTLTVICDRKGALTFDGVHLATVSTRSSTGPKASNWSTIVAYRTSEGRFLVQCTSAKHDVERTEWEVFSTRKEAQEWLGWGSLPIKLYQAAGWPI